MPKKIRKRRNPENEENVLILEALENQQIKFLFVDNNLSFRGDGILKKVGLYPKKWRIFSINALEIASFDITNIKEIVPGGHRIFPIIVLKRIGQ